MPFTRKMPHNFPGAMITSNEEFTGTRKSLLGRLFCRHRNLRTYKLIDHRSGPGWMSDAHSCVVCQCCGAVVKSTQIY